MNQLPKIEVTQAMQDELRARFFALLAQAVASGTLDTFGKIGGAK